MLQSADFCECQAYRDSCQLIILKTDKNFLCENEIAQNALKWNTSAAHLKIMIHMDAMLDSFSKTMSRSGFTFHNKSSNVSSSGGSSTLSRSSLGSNPISGSKVFSARVVFLDDTCQTFEVDKRAKGQYLIDTVFRHLDLGEREFFGLMFNDSGADHVPDGHSPDVMRWLDPAKLIRKQVRVHCGQKSGISPVATLFFRVKFYVTGKKCTDD